MPELRPTMYLSPENTVRVWQERQELRPTVRWSEMMHEEHSRAFTVAKIAKLDLLAAVQKSLDKVIRDGGTFETWKANILPELKRAGWWGEVSDRALTGTDEPIIVNDRRLRTIYRTNIRMSIAAGRWRRFQAQKELFPYLRYRSDHPRKHPRQDHLSWHGIILPVDHPWWQEHFPPNGWGCNCLPEQVSEGMLNRRGWKVTTDLPPSARERFYPAGRTDPIMVPKGIDPGFSYNPGTAHLRAIADKALESVEAAAQAGLAKAAQQTIREIVADPAFDQFAALPDQPFPIAALTADQASAIGATARTVRFSPQTLEKQKRRHAELTIADYRLLPEIISNPSHALREDDRKVRLLWESDGQWWRATVKATEQGDELYVLSMHRVGANEVAALVRRFAAIVEWFSAW